MPHSEKRVSQTWKGQALTLLVNDKACILHDAGCLEVRQYQGFNPAVGRKALTRYSLVVWSYAYWLRFLARGVLRFLA